MRRRVICDGRAAYPGYRQRHRGRALRDVPCPCGGRGGTHRRVHCRRRGAGRGRRGHRRDGLVVLPGSIDLHGHFEERYRAQRRPVPRE